MQAASSGGRNEISGEQPGSIRDRAVHAMQKRIASNLLDGSERIAAKLETEMDIPCPMVSKAAWLILVALMRELADVLM